MGLFDDVSSFVVPDKMTTAERIEYEERTGITLRGPFDPADPNVNQWGKKIFTGTQAGMAAGGGFIPAGLNAFWRGRENIVPGWFPTWLGGDGSDRQDKYGVGGRKWDQTGDMFENFGVGTTNPFGGYGDEASSVSPWDSSGSDPMTLLEPGDEWLLPEITEVQQPSANVAGLLPTPGQWDPPKKPSSVTPGMVAKTYKGPNHPDYVSNMGPGPTGPSPNPMGGKGGGTASGSVGGWTPYMKF